MYKYTNKQNLPFALVTFLMYDGYEYDPRPNAISATTLMRPIRQLVLMIQNHQAVKEVDIADLIPSRVGSAIHDGCERAWEDRKNVEAALRAMNASDAAIERVKVNPAPGELGPNDIPIYVEQRHEKPLGKWIITGKFDLVLESILNDYKSTSVWTYIYDSNSENYSLQGSIYRWLVPHIIKSDYVNINYIFTDWSASSARQDSKYPQQRMLAKPYPIWAPEQTERWLNEKLAKLESLIDAPQEMLPECTEEELWASNPVWKYYKNPEKMTRATKNFDNAADADARMAEDGNVGVVVHVPGEVKACRYCPIVGQCTQAEKLLQSGRLTL